MANTPQYGSEVEPTGQADMYALDPLNGGPHVRDDSPAAFTGGRGPDRGSGTGLLLGGEVTNPGSAAPFGS